MAMIMIGVIIVKTPPASRCVNIVSTQTTCSYLVLGLIVRGAVTRPLRQTPSTPIGSRYIWTTLAVARPLIQASIGQQPNCFPDFRDGVFRFVSGAINDDYSLGVQVCGIRNASKGCCLRVRTECVRKLDPGSASRLWCLRACCDLRTAVYYSTYLLITVWYVMLPDLAFDILSLGT